MLPDVLPRLPTTAPIRSAPFSSAEEAWFWTCGTLRAREAGVVRPPLVNGIPCRVEDVLKCLDMLYRHRRVELLHVRVLREWGWREETPDPAIPRQRCDAQLWREALDRLDWKLRMRGLVG